MPYKVSDMTATILPESIFSDNNGPRIYLLGGCISNQLCTINATTNVQSCACVNITDSCVYFTPQTDTWHTCAKLLSTRYRHMAARLGNDIYLIGGREVPSDNIIDTMDKYDPIADKWTRIVSSSPLITSDGVAFSVGDSIYQIGGYDPYYDSMPNTTIFNSVTGAATLGPSMSVPRGDTQIAFYQG